MPVDGRRLLLFGMGDDECMITVQRLFRRHVDGRWRFWGHGTGPSGSFTFWKLDRKYGWRFKQVTSYANGYLDVERKVAEQQAKGYVDYRLTRYLRQAIRNGYMLAVIIDRTHRKRR